MRLMNAELAESLEKYPLYSQDGKKADAVVVAKYFFPATALTWYVTEGRKEDGHERRNGLFLSFTITGVEFLWSESGT